jgi:hypothetical protein
MMKGGGHTESMLYTRAELEEFGYMQEALQWMDEAVDIPEVQQVDQARRVLCNMVFPLGHVVRHIPSGELLVSACAYRMEPGSDEPAWFSYGGGGPSEDSNTEFVEGSFSSSITIHLKDEPPCSRCGDARCPRVRGGKWALCCMDPAPPEPEQRPLTMREAWSCVDDEGRFRCPSCGKFTTSEKITRGNLLQIQAGTLVSVSPRCDKCAAG